MRNSIVLIWGFGTLVATSLLATCAADDTVNFAADVKPIFEQHCYRCHGPKLQESNYRLDFRDSGLNAADFGDPPIVKGDAANSPLYQFVAGLHTDDIVMPPDGDGRRLTQAETDVVKRWIDSGAEWPDSDAGHADVELKTDHWSFQPVVNSVPPDVDDVRCKTPIDAFVLRKLRASGLDFSQTADRVSLIRRVYLDMHGLPPTEEQVSAFLNDPSADAFDRVIDDVLESHHYGERWARHWLDVARFGESTGFEVNRDRENAYYYRDYVIDALNSDKSYRDFVIDQLAGGHQHQAAGA
ncbi:MAG: DUF1549 domain-containing protein, partial [Planctomycetales bacterium]|nr:DUF1549 domain-containing protein [Planctomycetales bacterium]